MRRPLVIGNWKMNGDRDQCQRLIASINSGYTSTEGDVDIVVCPPSVYLREVHDQLRQQSSVLNLGGQNVSDQISGAYTGELSAGMLKDAGCTYVLIGHSERRSLFGEDNVVIARKVLATLDAGMIPVLCVGETLSEFELGQTQAVVLKQVMDVAAIVGIKRFDRVVIAYEPVWAIGTGKVATPDYAQEMHRYIRGQLSAKDGLVGESVRILYGGSVTAENSGSLFKQTDIDGALVGGASLSADQFVSICAIANRVQLRIAS